ncbi:uncharacterized protein LOC132058425 [Lycium ferocissimum]|uniref:uncharacterized protein LOC132058425 n=1 Tax=Lycium ferocissimum TaxID=112874 RepID=UPI0028164068|nr:uncharacterized protein LOC132058425 [Lycium ferocissimum]
MLLPVPEGAFAVRLVEDASIKTKVVNVTKGTFNSPSFHFARTPKLLTTERFFKVSFLRRKDEHKFDFNRFPSRIWHFKWKIALDGCKWTCMSVKRHIWVLFLVSA